MDWDARNNFFKYINVNYKAMFIIYLVNNYMTEKIWEWNFMVNHTRAMTNLFL